MYDNVRYEQSASSPTARYDYDICLLMLLKCFAVYDSLTKSKKSATTDVANSEWSSDEEFD